MESNQVDLMKIIIINIKMTLKFFDEVLNKDIEFNLKENNI